MTPTLLAFASTRSESFVFVELTEFSTRGKSPVLKEPAPANVLDELLGDKISESPIWTMEPVPTLSIFTCPTIAGIVLTPLRMDTLLLHSMTVFAQRCHSEWCHSKARVHILEQMRWYG
jgi:hypothetical protein